MQGWLLWEDTRRNPHVGQNRFQTDPLMAKAEPISNISSVSVKTYLRKSKSCCKIAVREEWENVRKTGPQTPRSVKKEGEKVLQASEKRFSCSLWRRPWWGRLTHAAHGWLWWSTYALQSVEEDSMLQQVNVPWRKMHGPMESPHWSRVLAGAVTCGGTPLQQTISEVLYPVGRTPAGAVLEELQPVGRTRIGEAHEGLYPLGEIPHWSRGRMWGGLNGRDEVLQTDHNPRSFSPCILGGEEVEEPGVKLSLGRMEG